MKILRCSKPAARSKSQRAGLTFADQAYLHDLAKRLNPGFIVSLAAPCSEWPCGVVILGGDLDRPKLRLVTATAEDG